MRTSMVKWFWEYKGVFVDLCQNVLTSFFRRFSIASDVFSLFLNLALGQKQAAVLGPDAFTHLRQLSLAAGSKRRAGGLGGLDR